MRDGWTNQQDRIVVDLPVVEAARRVERSPSAVKQRRTKLRKLPCPFWVWSTIKGLGREMIFCEEGEGGHEGACCGGRSIDEYRLLGGTFSYEEEQETRETR